MKENRKEWENLADEMITKFFELELANAKEKHEIDEDREKIIRKKFELDKAEAHAKRRLNEVTHNDYKEIGVMMNELREGIVKLYEDAYERCKKWLDDNQLPYCNIEDEEDNEYEEDED